MITQKIIRSSLAILIVLLVTQLAAAGPSGPLEFVYTGVLEQNGVPVTSEELDFTFTLFSAEDGGAVLCGPEARTLPVAGGKFSAEIGASCDRLGAVLRQSPEVYLEVAVEGNTMSPRQKLQPVPYAVVSKTTSAIPTGMIMPFFGGAPTEGWLVADGRTIDKSKNPEYAALVDHLRALGAGYEGTEPTQAILPDLRGVFLRGQDMGRGLNPNAGTDAIGQYQADDNKSHSHSASSGNAGNHGHSGSTSTAGNHSHSISVSGGAHEHPVGQAGGYAGSAVLYGTSDDTSGSQICIDRATNCTDTVTSWKAISSTSNHTHSTGCSTTGNHSHGLSINAAGNHAHSISVGASGGSESRPKNVTVLYLIKY